MNRGFYLVVAAQALSSIADNALFIAAIALIQQLHGPDWMAPVIKWFFAMSYVTLAAFVGALSDSYPKGQVMFATNGLKVVGCLMMFCYALFNLSASGQVTFVCVAYALVGIGAAGYSPAKYGIVTEMLAPMDLVKGNSWIEGMTVLSIILGTVIGGVLISPTVSELFLHHALLSKLVTTPAEAAILMIAFIYSAAAIINLAIPNTRICYPIQQKNPLKLVKAFGGYVMILWRDKLGQISLAVTTLFWGAGATLQLIVIEWGKQHMGYRLDQTSILMGITALGTAVGAVAAGKVPLNKSLRVLPIGVVMGFLVMLMPWINTAWSAYILLFAIGATSGFFVVPMNALLQHRGHVLLSAGHSIAVQNFNEQINSLLMVAIYTFLLYLKLPINTIITLFASIVAALMIVLIRWSHRNLRRDPELCKQIGQEGHGTAL